jgi:hypothetical protein
MSRLSKCPVYGVIIRSPCPGDMVLLSYVEIPIVEDLYCKIENGNEVFYEDVELDGRNHWTIINYEHSHYNYSFRVMRPMLTKDKKLDTQLLRLPDKIFYGLVPNFGTQSRNFNVPMWASQIIKNKK